MPCYRLTKLSPWLPPIMMNASPIRLRINRSCESDILLHLAASVRRFALMPFICIQSGPERWYVEFAIPSDLLVGSYRVLKTLRMYVVVSNHVWKKTKIISRRPIYKNDAILKTTFRNGKSDPPIPPTEKPLVDIWRRPSIMHVWGSIFFWNFFLIF